MMNNLQFWIVFVTTFIFIPQIVVNTDVNTDVNTSSGKISGRIIFFNGVPIRAFLGIPYATPPVGELRFKNPVPVQKWKNVLKADKLPPACVQPLPRFPYLRDVSKNNKSENCLYINIWVPLLSIKKAVMFYVHGGAFTVGSNSLDVFNGEAVAAEGDVIIVTTNYRLGAFGFLYSGTSDAPGNMGMLDIIEALKWVKKNIEYFGGDKDSITLVGQSAGAIAAGMFCVSPLTKGLFNRVIMESGTPASLDFEDSDRGFITSQKLAKSLGCANNSDSLRDHPSDVVACLRRVNASSITEKLGEVTEGSYRSYFPRFGDEFLPKNARKAIANGDFRGVDVLIGCTDGDGSDLLTSSNTEIFGYFGEKDPKINYSFGESILRKGLDRVNYPDPDGVVEQYLGNVEKDNYDEIRFQLLTAYGDYDRLCPSEYFAESFNKKNVRTYFYYFTHITSVSPWAPWMLAVHLDETPYLFGYPLRHPENYTFEEKILSKRMIRAWASFAKTGRPSGWSWPTYTKESRRYQTIDIDDNSIGYGPHASNCDFGRSTFGF